VPTSNAWVALYALSVWIVSFAFEYVTDLHLDVLVPAFALGCIIKSDHLHGSAEYGATNEGVSSQDPKWQALLDWGIKGGFMLLAGMALPPLQFGGMRLGAVILHVILITLLSNIGNAFPWRLTRPQLRLASVWHCAWACFLEARWASAYYS